MKENTKFEHYEKKNFCYSDYYVNGKLVRDYKYLKSEYYRNELLSWENCSYSYSLSKYENGDDYLLNHALQDNKKLCVTLSVDNPEFDLSCWKDYNTRIIKKQDDKYLVIAARKGCLNDYFDIDEIENCYDSFNVWTNGVILPMLFEIEIIDLVAGNYVMLNDRKYEPFFDNETDSNHVLETYRAEGVIVAGLIFGYPIETTLCEINHLEHWWFSKLM